MTFQYKVADGEERVGTVMQVAGGNPLELLIEADGRMFHTIVGKHQNGNYICIPNWDVGSEYMIIMRRKFQSKISSRHCVLHRKIKKGGE